MTKKYILLSSYNGLHTKFYTLEEVKEMLNEVHYYYETYMYPTNVYGNTKEETIKKALDYHGFTDVSELVERNGYGTFEQFVKECIINVKRYHFSCYEVGENELIYIEELSNDEE
jgi:hypothetical protein